MADLAVEAESLIKHSLAENTWKTYKVAVESLNQFRAEHYLPIAWPISLEHLIQYISYLSYSNFAHASISTYISGFSHQHKLLGVSDPTQNFLVTKMLEGTKFGKRRDRRIPVSLELLTKIVTSLHLICNSNYEALLFSAAFSLFFALLRVGEITADSRSNDGVHTLRAGDISFKDNYMHVTIRSSKADQHGEQVTLILSKQEKGLCPIKAMNQFLDIRYPSQISPIFLHFDGSVVTRYEFNAVLQKALAFRKIRDHVRPHSFRIGGATELSRIGGSPTPILKGGVGGLQMLTLVTSDWRHFNTNIQLFDCCLW